jgi:hypothetical protein
VKPSPALYTVAVVGGVASAALLGAAVTRRDWKWAIFHGGIAALCVVIVNAGNKR